MSKRVANIEGNIIPFKVSNGQVYLAGEKLNELIINQFGKESGTVYFSLYLEERKPSLIFHTPIVEAPEAIDYSSSFPMAALNEQANDNESEEK